MACGSSRRIVGSRLRGALRALELLHVGSRERKAAEVHILCDVLSAGCAGNHTRAALQCPAEQNLRIADLQPPG